MTTRNSVPGMFAAFLAAATLAGCALPTEAERAEATTGRITRVVPVVIESDTAPGLGSALAPKTANRKGQRIQVLTNDQVLIEVTQDEVDPPFRAGESVRIEGWGTKAKIRRP